MAQQNYIDPRNPNGGSRIYRQEPQTQTEEKSTNLNETVRKFSSIFYKLGVAASTYVTTKALLPEGSETDVTMAMATISSTLIGYGLSTYSNGPEAESLAKMWEMSVEKELSRRLMEPSAPTDSVVANAVSKITRDLVKTGCLEASSAYKGNMRNTLLKLSLKPLNLVEFMREVVMLWKKTPPQPESMAKYHNFFGQHSQFEVNLAHLAALMASENPRLASDVFVGIESPSVTEFLKNAPDIISLFAANKIHLTRMLDVFRHAIGPDASFIFGKEDLKIHKLHKVLRPLLADVVYKSARHAELLNISTLLFDMANQLENSAEPDIQRDEACLVVAQLKESLLDKSESHKRFNVTAAEPERRFKYEGILQACDAFTDRYKSNSHPRHTSQQDLIKALYPKQSDSPFVEKKLWAPDERGVFANIVVYKKKTTHEAYAIGMSEALKDAIRYSPTVYQHCEDPAGAINEIANRVMLKVFLLATGGGRNKKPQPPGEVISPKNAISPHEPKQQFKRIPFM